MRREDQMRRQDQTRREEQLELEGMPSRLYRCTPTRLSTWLAGWIGAGGRAYVSRYALDPARAVGLVRATGGAVVLAHPGAISRGMADPR
jgi:hypothetical protein